MKKSFLISCALCTLGLNTSIAHAHATLEQKTAPVNSTYKAVMRIGHGCKGSPTTSLAVQIPEGVIKVKPKAIAGWRIEIKEADYAKAYKYHGKTIKKGPVEVKWIGGPLPNNHYEEFIFRARITDAFKAGETVYFPTVQNCEKGDHAWVEIPEKGQSSRDLRKPAPGLKLLEGKKHHHH